MWELVPEEDRIAELETVGTGLQQQIRMLDNMEARVQELLETEQIDELQVA